MASPRNEEDHPRFCPSLSQAHWAERMQLPVLFHHHRDCIRIPASATASASASAKASSAATTSAASASATADVKVDKDGNVTVKANDRCGAAPQMVGADSQSIRRR